MNKHTTWGEFGEWLRQAGKRARWKSVREYYAMQAERVARYASPAQAMMSAEDSALYHLYRDHQAAGRHENYACGQGLRDHWDGGEPQDTDLWAIEARAAIAKAEGRNSHD